MFGARMKDGGCSCFGETIRTTFVSNLLGLTQTLDIQIMKLLIGLLLQPIALYGFTAQPCLEYVLAQGNIQAVACLRFLQVSWSYGDS